MSEPKKTFLQALIDALQPAHCQWSAPLELREDNSGSKCRLIKLSTGSGQAFLLRSDDSQGVGQWLSNIFQPSVPKLTQICDYIVFYQRKSRPGDERQSRLFVLPCELKSENVRGALSQITNGKILGEYIVSVVRNNTKIAEQPEIVYRGLIFHSKLSVPRLSLTADQAPDYQPHPRMQDFQFLHLPCGREQTLSLLCRD